MMLNVHSIRFSNNTNGPGRRIVVWVQGCTLNCPGCFNQVQHPHEPVNLVDTKVLSRRLVEKLIEFDCEGITITGGEPFQQSKAVFELCESIQNQGYTVVVFSGYTKDEINKSTISAIQNLFKKSDILILGRYNHKNLHSDRTWRTNPDKEVIFNSGIYRNRVSTEPNCFEILIDEGNLLITGFPKNEEILSMKKLFSEYGINLL